MIIGTMADPNGHIAREIAEHVAPKRAEIIRIDDPVRWFLADLVGPSGYSVGFLDEVRDAVGTGILVRCAANRAQDLLKTYDLEENEYGSWVQLRTDLVIVQDLTRDQRSVAERLGLIELFVDGSDLDWRDYAESLWEDMR